MKMQWFGVILMMELRKFCIHNQLKKVIYSNFFVGFQSVDGLLLKESHVQLMPENLIALPKDPLSLLEIIEIVLYKSVKHKMISMDLGQ